MDLAVGGEVELELMGRTLLVRSRPEGRRRRRVARATQEVLGRRRRLFERLAAADRGPERGG